MELRIKYFDGATELKKINKGNWIDVYANKDVFIPYMGYAMIPLGFALELPKEWEGHLAPRSSTFNTWGIIETNSVGVVDDTYIGDDDQWHFPAQCTMAKSTEKLEVAGNKVTMMGTWIKKGDKIAQFRIMESMPETTFRKTSSLGNNNRGGFGSTGNR